jgi:hypothetical protein
VSWPPEVGEPLPRAAEAWSQAHEWSDWILSERGHGPEFERVLHVTLEQVDVLWEAIAAAVLLESVSKVIDRGEHGITCRVDVGLTIAGRSAPIRTAWHFADADSAPRLVSAYPRL